MNKKLYDDCEQQLRKGNTPLKPCKSCGNPPKAYVTENWNFEINCLHKRCKIKTIMQSTDRKWKKLVTRWNEEMK